MVAGCLATWLLVVWLIGSCLFGACFVCVVVWPRLDMDRFNCCMSLCLIVWLNRLTSRLVIAGCLATWYLVVWCLFCLFVCLATGWQGSFLKVAWDWCICVWLTRWLVVCMIVWSFVLFCLVGCLVLFCFVLFNFVFCFVYFVLFEWLRRYLFCLFTLCGVGLVIPLFFWPCGSMPYWVLLCGNVCARQNETPRLAPSIPYRFVCSFVGLPLIPP